MLNQVDSKVMDCLVPFFVAKASPGGGVEAVLASCCMQQRDSLRFPCFLNDLAFVWLLLASGRQKGTYVQPESPLRI